MNAEFVGKKIREYRKFKGYTQEELAEKVGISTMSVRRYETGERIAPQSVLVKIAKILGVHLRNFADTSIWNEFDEENFNNEVKEFSAFEKYLNSLGFILQIDPVSGHYEEMDTTEELKELQELKELGEIESARPPNTMFVEDKYEITLIKDGKKATFTQEEFEELQGKTNNAAQEVIDARFYKKLLQQK